MRITARKGDWAILAAAAAIAAYEKLVRDDEDLISCRVAAYKRRAPLATYSVVLITAAHLLELLPEGCDPYRWAVRYFRTAATTTTHPTPAGLEHPLG